MSDPYRQDGFEQRMRRLEMSVVCITEMIFGNPRLADDVTTESFKEAYPKLFQALSELYESVSPREAE